MNWAGVELIYARTHTRNGKKKRKEGTERKELKEEKEEKRKEGREKKRRKRRKRISHWTRLDEEGGWNLTAVVFYCTGLIGSRGFYERTDEQTDRLKEWKSEQVKEALKRGLKGEVRLGLVLVLR
jgi:hypothetical protein